MPKRRHHNLSPANGSDFYSLKNRFESPVAHEFFVLEIVRGNHQPGSKNTDRLPRTNPKKLCEGVAHGTWVSNKTLAAASQLTNLYRLFFDHREEVTLDAILNFFGSTTTMLVLVGLLVTLGIAYFLTKGKSDN
jgi:hypothetical protein